MSAAAFHVLQTPIEIVASLAIFVALIGVVVALIALRRRSESLLHQSKLLMFEGVAVSCLCLAGFLAFKVDFNTITGRVQYGLPLLCFWLSVIKIAALWKKQEQIQ